MVQNRLTIVEVEPVPAWSFARRTIFNPDSRGCFWKHPIQAGRMVFSAGHNKMLALGERLWSSDRRECPVCRWTGRVFHTYISPGDVIPDSICPRCGSFDRQRYLVFGMRKVLEHKARVPQTLLGLSLSKSMSYLLAHEGLGRCFRADYERVDPRYQPDVAADLRRAGFRNASFDWIVCSHVLDYIPQLDEAVDELVRLLRPGGLAWIQVAYQEDLSLSHQIRDEPWVQGRHVWRFGKDFSTLLQRSGWEITAEHAAAIAPERRHRHGIHPVERYWLGRKNES